MMEWYDQYSVHIGQMDRRSLGQSFRALEVYIHRHFADEEDLMLLHGYPGYAEQKREHERFIDEICSYRKEFVKGRTPVMINMFNSIWDWFARHILLQDKRYESFLQARGCR